MTHTRTRIALFGALAALLLSAFVVAGCGGGDDADAAGESGGNGDGGTLSLVAYSTPREAYEEIIPAFQETPEGEGWDFEQSYAASGEQRRAVEEGLPADVVHLSLEPDVTALVDAGLVDASWNQNEYDGILTNSVVVFAVRPGNPEGIETWDDLLNEGVEVITPNPFTSGGAQWNIMAAYGAQLEQGKSDEEAIAYLRELFLEHVPVQDKSAREALQTFAGGKGDVMLAYENEAIFAQQAGEELEYVVPAETILIENPAAVVIDEREPGSGAGVPRLPLHARGAGGLRLEGLPPGRRGRGDGVRLLGPGRPLHDRRPRRVGRRPQALLRPRGERSSSTSRTSWECPLTTSPEAVRLPARTGASRRAGGLVLGLSTAYLTLIVLIPIAAVIATSFEGGVSAFWDEVTSPAAVAALKLTFVASLVVVLVNAAHRHAHRLGARPRRLPRQERRQCGRSTCRSPCRRSWPG